MFFSLSLILFGIALYLWWGGKRARKVSYFEDISQDVPKLEFQAINVKSLNKGGRFQRIKDECSPILAMLGDRATVIITVFLSTVVMVAWYINSQLLHLHSQWVTLLFPVVMIWMGWGWLIKKRRNDFERSFPDALNLLMSAVTAGDSLMQAISYVGESLDNGIGREFKNMGERLKMGESPDVVFQRASKNYPYPAFLFFVVTMRANMARGGQLKSVLARLIRVLVDARTLEKKKMAMTSEARISAKIVAAIPVLFMVLLNYINPANVDFILNDPQGRYVLYYVLGSEAIGLGIVWLLVRSVK
ncbi:type II secretion system protein F [Photobacterium aquae]|uniref:Type II secretion system protein F n=1 Tax=Photobacterium aquae TaxID=1195763 RepID=A0A0J1GWS0_9GAMM|nr:type II secretion system F family protein [Photobacterium aquae]KLV04168.1 type II secretion system protein F [Photobacterium aquae]